MNALEALKALDPTTGMSEADLVALRDRVYQVIEGPLLQDQ